MGRFENLNREQRKILQHRREIIDRQPSPSAAEPATMFESSGAAKEEPQQTIPLYERLIEQALELRKTTPERREPLTDAQAIEAAIRNNQQARGIFWDRKKLLRSLRAALKMERNQKLL